MTGSSLEEAAPAAVSPPAVSFPKWLPDYLPGEQDPVATIAVSTCVISCALTTIYQPAGDPAVGSHGEGAFQRSFSQNALK